MRRYVANLRALLVAGEVEKTKHGLTSLVARVEVEGPSRRAKRNAGNTLVVWPRLKVAIALLEAESARTSSPGGILALASTLKLPPVRVEVEG